MVVLLSGRPLILGDVLDAASAVVAAWLPGTEGDGVADVLFGAYKPTGQALVLVAGQHVADPDQRRRSARYAPLFPFGYGLSW